MINKKNNVKGSAKQPKMFSVRDIIPMLSRKLAISAKTKGKKQSNKKKARQPTKSLAGLETKVALSECALRYALAVTDPFDPTAQGACIPSYPSLDSYKTHGFVRIDGVIGTSGVGWVLVCPTLASNLPVAFYTNALYTLSDINPLSAANILQTGVVTATMGNLPYSSSDLVHTAATNNPLVQGRIVATAVSIQYTGTTLNEAGLSYCYRSPSHANVTVIPGTSSSASTSDLSQFVEVGIESFDRMRCELVDYASCVAETTYSGANELSSDAEAATAACYPYCQGNSNFNGLRTYASSSVNVGSPTMVVMVTGVAGQSFHCDLISHVEFIGKKAASSATPSHADPIGFQRVLTACQNIQAMKTANPKMSNWSAFYSALKGVVKAAKPMVVPAAKSAMVALLA